MYCKGKTVLNRTILNVELCNTVLKITRSVDLFVVYRGAQRSDAVCLKTAVNPMRTHGNLSTHYVPDYCIIILYENTNKRHIKYNKNKNLAIANRSRISCAHNTLRAFIGLNITP